MAYRYTDPNTRAVFDSASGQFRAAGLTARFWLDSGLTQPVEVGLFNPSAPEAPGPSIGSNQLTVQDDSMWPAMWDLGDGQDHLWVQVGTSDNPGEPYRIFCDPDQRLDALDSRLTALEPGGSAEAATADDLADVATAAQTAAASAAATGAGLAIVFGA